MYKSQKNVNLKGFFVISVLFFIFRRINTSRGKEINITRKKMKEESKRYLTALWLAGNSTKTDLQSIRMVLNATRGNIVRQLKEVQDNLTEQVHYL